MKTHIKKIPVYFLDILFWLMFTLYMTGGVRISGRLKLSYLNDIWITIAVLFLVLRLCSSFRFHNLTFGKYFRQTADAAIPFSLNRIKHATSTFKLPHWILLTGALWFSFLYFFLPLFSFWSFGNSTYDLGIFDNAIWNGANSGRFFTWFLTHKDQAVNYFPNNHLNFGLVFFALLYKIAPLTEWLMLFQSAALFFAIIPLYKLADRILPKEMPRWWIVLMYFLWDPVHRINTWDFHEAPFIIFFSLWALYFLEVSKLKLMVLFSLLTAIWKEDAWWVFSGIMIYSAIKTRLYFRFLSLSILGLLVLPIHAAYFNQINQLNQRYNYLGTNFTDAFLIISKKPWILIQALIENKTFLLRLILSSGLGLFLFSGFAIIPTLPPLLEIALSTDPGMLGWQNHYVGHFTGPLFFATLYGVKNIYSYTDKVSLRSLIVPISASIALTQLYFNEAGAFRMTLNRYKETRCLKEAVQMIPKDAKIIVGDPISTHLAHREWIALPEPNRDLSAATWFADHNDKYILNKPEWERVPFNCPNLYLAKKR